MLLFPPSSRDDVCYPCGHLLDALDAMLDAIARDDAAFVEPLAEELGVPTWKRTLQLMSGLAARTPSASPAKKPSLPARLVWMVDEPGSSYAKLRPCLQAAGILEAFAYDDPMARALEALVAADNVYLEGSAEPVEVTAGNVELMCCETATGWTLQPGLRGR